jgi:hypothetical protein
VQSGHGEFVNYDYQRYDDNDVCGCNCNHHSVGDGANYADESADETAVHRQQRYADGGGNQFSGDSKEQRIGQRFRDHGFAEYADGESWRSGFVCPDGDADRNFPGISVAVLWVTIAVGSNVQLFCREPDRKPQQRSTEQDAGHYNDSARDHPGESAPSRPDLCVLAADFRIGAGWKRHLATQALADCDCVGSRSGRDYFAGRLLEYQQLEHNSGNPGGNLPRHGECHFGQRDQNDRSKFDSEVIAGS